MFLSLTRHQISEMQKIFLAFSLSSGILVLDIHLCNILNLRLFDL